MIIYFLSSNQGKIDEVKAMLSSVTIKVEPITEKINEIQSQDMLEIVTNKAIEAFARIGRPVVVDQTGMFLHDLGGFPGGLTQIFWDSLEADKFSKYFSSTGGNNATIKTILAYCDGKQIHIFDGAIDGRIVDPPRGNRAFQWDCVFEPEGFTETFAEMGVRKNDISMRKMALEKLRQHLEAGYGR